MRGVSDDDAVCPASVIVPGDRGLSGAGPDRVLDMTRTRLSWIATGVALGTVAAGLAAPSVAQAAGGTGVVQSARPQAAPAEGALPSVRAGVVKQDLWVRTKADTDRDGKPDRVHIVVERPKSKAKLSTIFSISPYAAGGNDEVPNHDVDHELWYPGAPSAGPAGTERFLKRGYARVFAYSLGSGRSTGCPTVGDRQETAGPLAVIQWLNGRAVAVNAAGKKVKAGWANGKVGMIGTSYDGTLPNAVAATGVKGLKAIIPVSAISSWYDYYRANGLVVAPGGYQGEDVDVLAKFVYTRANQKICQPVFRRMERDQDRRSGDYGSFWRRRDYTVRADKVDAAVLVAHGLNDWNVKPGAAARWYDALKRAGAEHMIYWHPGGHGGEPPAEVVDKWFDHYLYGVKNGIDKGPRSLIDNGTGQRWEKDWPLPAAKDRTYHLAAPADGEIGSLVTEDTTGSQSFTDDASYGVRQLVSQQATDHGLIYQTAALTQDTRLSGTPSVDLNLTFDRPAANVTVAVVDLDPDGTFSRVVTRGWTDPQNARSIRTSEALVPGQPYQLDFDLEPNDWVFASGHRIGFVLMSSDQDFTIRPAPGAGLDLDLSQSTVTLPLH